MLFLRCIHLEIYGVKKMKYIILKFSDIKLDPRDIPKVRGFFGSKFSEETTLHNHLPGGKFSYKFPQIQYRLIDSCPALIAKDDGIDVIKKFFYLTDEMIIDNKHFSVNEKEIVTFESDFGQSENIYHYKFTSPYMALNQSNHEIYKKLDNFDKQDFINNMIRANLTTLAKGFNYHIPDRDKIKVKSILKAKNVNYKNVRMLCFIGEFKTNFIIPDYWGIGKQSAKGFGVVKMIK